jgi:hypothetical protein
MTDQMKTRCNELHSLGLKFNGEYYQNESMGAYVHHTDILCYDDAEWDKTIKVLTEIKQKQS